MNVAFDIVQPRVPDGLGVYLKSCATGRVYRIEPVRYHIQPRFWILRVVRYIRPGVADNTIAPWYSDRICTLAELPAVLAGIRADVSSWLRDDPQQSLRDWINACELARPAEITADGVIRPRVPATPPSPSPVETRIRIDAVPSHVDLADPSSTVD
jgi:hypothetical protein